MAVNRGYKSFWRRNIDKYLEYLWRSTDTDLGEIVQVVRKIPLKVASQTPCLCQC